MFERPKISVIILIYNVEQYIERCIESLYNQTLNSIEYIFVNDCSSDKSIIKLKRLMALYPERAANSLIINNETNLGQAKSRFKAIKSSHGKYVTFCDSDDYVALNAYEVLYDYIESTTSDLIACGFNRVTNNRQSIEIYSGKDTAFDWIKDILLTKKMGSLWCHLIKKDLLNDLQCPEGNVMEDVAILVQCLLKSNKVSTIRTPLYYYCYRPNSITNLKEKVLEQALHMQANLNLVAVFLKRHNLLLKKEIESKAFFIKKWLLPIIQSPRDCQSWLRFKPNRNYKFFINKYICKQDKIRIFLIYIRLYPLIRLIRS